MPEILEYEYDSPHLTEAEAIERYQREKALYPKSIVELKGFDCGHWEVKTYSSEKEKQEFLGKKLSEMINRFFSILKK